MFTVKSSFPLIFNRNWVRIVTNQDILISIWMNDDLYCYWIHCLLFYTYSNPFAGFESTTVRAIRKYKFKKILVWTSYFDVFDITTSSGEVAVRLGIDSATLLVHTGANTCLHMYVQCTIHTIRIFLLLILDRCCKRFDQKVWLKRNHKKTT